MVIWSRLRTLALGAPERLPEGAVRRYPELSGVTLRRGGVPLRIAGIALGQRTAAAITLWRTVFLARGVAASDDLLLHEVRHVQQFEASLTFPLRYLWASVRHGYHRNPYEVDAREYASARLRARDPYTRSEEG